MDALRKCVELKRKRTVYSLARSDGVDMWKKAELAVAVMVDGVLFTALDPSIRRHIHGGGIPADRGVDVVTADGGLYQVKWYKNNLRIGHDAVARLNNIAGAFQRKGGHVSRRVIVAKEGERLRSDIPGVDIVEIMYCTDSDIDITMAAAKMELMCLLDERGGRIRTPAGSDLGRVYDNLHEDVVERLTRIYDRGNGKSVISAELPPGSGKSYIIARLCQYHAAADGSVLAIVVEPRIDIVFQLVKKHKTLLDGFTVYTVTDGEDWPNSLADKSVVVMTGQSAGKIKLDRDVNVVIYDESHVEFGRSIIEASVPRDVTYMFSATIQGVPDYRLGYPRAVELGIICDARFAFVVFPRCPTYEDYANYIVQHPEHLSILVCLQRKQHAVDFAIACNAVLPGVAATYITRIEKDDRHAAARPEDERAVLEQFQRDGIRVLCVVTRVEMGVDIHRCDTILLVDVWDSMSRLRQLCGRATRHHPTKCGLYTIMFGVGPDPAHERRSLTRMIDALYEEIEDRCPRTVEELMDKIDCVPGIHYESPREEFEAVAAIRVSVYDSFGRHLTGEKQRLRAAFERDRVELVGRSVRTYEEFQALRVGSPELNLPEDPPETYLPLFEEEFPWYKYLDYDLPPTLADLQCIVAEVVARDAESESPVPLRSLAKHAFFAYERLAKRYSELPPEPLALFPTASYYEMFKKI